jgi:hypothetical protein
MYSGNTASVTTLGDMLRSRHAAERDSRFARAQETDEDVAARRLWDESDLNAARGRRRERCVVILAESDLSTELREHFLLLLDEMWAMELIEMYNDPILPRKHWREWCRVASREGKRYPFVIRKMQTRRAPFDKTTLGIE